MRRDAGVNSRNGGTSSRLSAHGQQRNPHFMLDLDLNNFENMQQTKNTTDDEFAHKTHFTQESAEVIGATIEIDEN